MAGSVNKVILIGRLGRDPELKYTPSGAPVCNFSLATDSAWKDKTGEQKQQTEWHKIITWGKLAEICSQYLTKGKQIYIEGSIRSRQWDDKQTGQKRTAYEIVAQRMQMLGSRSESERPAAAGAPALSPAEGEPPEPPPEPSSAPEITDEDIPF
jgi:single-strand DNA-binding protein